MPDPTGTDAAAATDATAAAAGAAATEAAAAAAAATAGSGAAAGAADAGASAALASGATDTTKAAVVGAADFPADWREKIAGKDDGFLNVLKRYDSPKSALEWARQQHLKVNAGELKPALKADATPEEIATYRKSHGLPEAPDGYIKDLKLPDGVVMGEADQPLLKSFAETALANNMSQAQFNAQVEWWNKTNDALEQQRSQADQDVRDTADQALRDQMGTDYKANMNALKTFWQDSPKGMDELLLTARTKDGRILGNVPEVVSFLANLSRELNPAAAILPTGSGTGPKAIADRKTEIEKMMYINGKPNPAYNSERRKEYRDLIDAELALEKRSRVA